MSSGASQNSLSGRREDFPVDSFRQLELRIGQIRRHVMAEAAGLAEAAAPSDASVYRVEPEHINLAFARLIENPAAIDLSPPVREKQITEGDAAVLLEFGWERLPAGSKFTDRPPTEEQARKGELFSVLTVNVEGKEVEFVAPGEQDAPLEGHLTVWEAIPYTHGAKQLFVWGC